MSVQIAAIGSVHFLLFFSAECWSSCLRKERTIMPNYLGFCPQPFPVQQSYLDAALYLHKNVASLEFTLETIEPALFQLLIIVAIMTTVIAPAQQAYILFSLIRYVVSKIRRRTPTIIEAHSLPRVYHHSRQNSKHSSRQGSHQFIRANDSFQQSTLDQNVVDALVQQARPKRFPSKSFRRFQSPLHKSQKQFYRSFQTQDNIAFQSPTPKQQYQAHGDEFMDIKLRNYQHASPFAQQPYGRPWQKKQQPHENYQRNDTQVHTLQVGK